MFRIKLKLDTRGVDRMLKKMKPKVPLGEVMTPSFMRRHSRHGDKDSFFAAVGMDETAFCELGDAEKDRLTREHTTFMTWQKLIDAGVTAYLK